MPNKQLTQQDNFETISTWLDENLINPFKANMQSLPPEDNSRGIYFWFMKPDGYQRLAALGLNITAINPTYPKIIEGETYHLVYLGTAGTGKKGNSNIINRLNWHLKTTHNEGDVCSGILSTLRQTVGAALSADLIETETATKVSLLFEELFYIYTLPYTGEANTKERIDNDEYTLISVLKPLFNIKNNPNARITAGQHPTRQLKVRRGFVMRETRERLGCKKGENGETKSKKDDIKPPKSPINNYELIYDKDGCQEFTVTKDQSVHEVVSGIEGLPTGKCEIVIYDSANPKAFIYTSKHNEGKRVTGGKKISIYGYFNNPDTNKNDQPRWKLIQQEMLDKGIEEITVRVCSDDVKNLIQNDKIDMKETFPIIETTIKQLKSLELIKSQFEDLNLSKEFIIVFPCSNEKNGSELIYEDKTIRFRALSNVKDDQFKPDDISLVNNFTWKKYISSSEVQNGHQLLEANTLYKDSIYRKLADCFGERLYISSAGWGIIRNKFRIPKYDITFKNNKDKSTYRAIKDGFLLDLNHLKEDKNILGKEDIVFLGGLSYVPQFFELTKDLSNKKFILSNGNLSKNLGKKLYKKINDSPLFQIHNFNITDRLNWQIRVAEYVIQIYLSDKNE